MIDINNYDTPRFLIGECQPKWKLVNGIGDRNKERFSATFKCTECETYICRVKETTAFYEKEGILSELKTIKCRLANNKCKT